jgi:PAS domain S-box-containing protein
VISKRIFEFDGAASPSPAIAYGLTVTAIIVAAVIRWCLDPLIGQANYFFTFLAACVLASWVGGWRPATLSLAGGLIVAWYFFIPVRFTIFEKDPSSLVAAMIFVAIGILFILFGEAMRRTRQQARHQAELLRITLASIGDAVIATDVESKVTFLNDVARSLTGWPGDQAVGLPLETIFQIVNEQTRQAVQNPTTQALQEGVVVGLANHTVLIRKDGSEIPIEDSAAPIRDSANQIVGSVLVFRDVRKQRQAELIAHSKLLSAQFLASIVESSEDAIISKSLDGTILSWNRSAERLFGYTSDESIGRPITMLIPAERLGEEETIISRLQSHERIDHFETLRARRDGELIDVSLTISPIKDETGEVVGAAKIVRNITERKRVEAALLASERDLNDFFENAVVGLRWLGPDGIILRANRAEIDLFGYSRDEYIGHHISEFHVEPRVSEDILQRLRNGELIKEYSAKFRCKDGSIKDVLIDSSVLWDKGRFVHSRCFTRDVSAQKRAEEALRNADRRKDEFLAILAHELRNPLAPIRNSLEILKRADNNDEAAAHARITMELQVHHMVRLVDDLLDISRGTRNNLELRKERVELQSILKQVVDVCQLHAQKSNHAILVDLPPEPIVVFGDSMRLSQVFSNLLTNACKYTDDGGTIRLNLSRQDDNAIVTIEDSGIGIPPELTSKVFEMFVQVDRTLERTQGGLGIGLTLVKELVELHDGTVSAFSDGPGKGSRFSVALPLETKDAKPATMQPIPSGKSAGGHRILIVDDNRDNAKTLSMLLKFSGNEVATAHDGDEAIREAESFRPSAVFLDIGLPKKNGYEVCEWIRKEPWGQEILIVAMTGWGQDEDRRKSRDSGFNAHLIKPIDLAEVETMLRHLKA